MAEDRVGKRVRVYWADEGEWFEGTVQQYDESQGFYVVYDDGDERWEPSDHQMEVQDEAEENDQPVESSRRPEMMEPPLSPGSAYDDEDTEPEDKHPDPEHDDEDVPQQDDQVGFNDTEYPKEDEEGQRSSEQEEDQDQDDDVENSDDNNGSGDDRSVVESEIPQTFDKRSSTKSGIRRAPSKAAEQVLSAAPVPSKGLLVGKVLRANGLRSSGALAPNAFVRVSFVESGDATHTSAMLRCKQTLATTSIARGSINPVWNEDPIVDQSDIETQGGFQLQLLPRIIPPATAPAWHQLPGDVLFTVYSALRSDGSTRSGANEHIGQATVSLRSLMHDMLTSSPFATRVLELRSRSGRRIGQGNVSTSSLFEDDAPALVVSFRFSPVYETPVKKKSTRSVVSASTSKTNRVAPNKTTSQKGYRLDQSRRSAPAKTSSSCINRRRFEKKVALDNQSFTKRLEWQQARRTRRIAEEKAQEKKKVNLPQYGARKHDHKASSEINRSKYVQRVAKENKTMGKRLQRTVGNDTGRAEAKDSSNYDYMDRDKAYVEDKRWQRQVELDFMMEKAQTKYQQQNQIVEEVMELQESVAGLKAQVDTLQKGVNRLDILMKKDQHVKDCLLKASANSSGSSFKQSPRVTRSTSRSTKTIRQSSATNQDDCEDAGKSRKMQELELLVQHQERLQADKQKLSEELRSLNQQETELDNEINENQAKWELAVATKLFHKQMERKTIVQVQKAEQDMMRRQKAMELSREEEEQWKCYQAHQELTQLQIGIQVLRDQRGEGSRVASHRASSSSSTVCDYLTKKIDKQKTKLQELEEQVSCRRRDYEALLVGGGNENLRKRVQELQKLVFLCKAQATHVKHAERTAQRKAEREELDFRRKLFDEQTETEVVLKRPQKL